MDNQILNNNSALDFIRLKIENSEEQAYDETMTRFCAMHTLHLSTTQESHNNSIENCILLSVDQCMIELN